MQEFIVYTDDLEIPINIVVTHYQKHVTTYCSDRNSMEYCNPDIPMEVDYIAYISCGNCKKLLTIEQHDLLYDKVVDFIDEHGIFDE